MKNNKKHHGRNNAISVFICSFVDIKTALAWRSICREFGVQYTKSKKFIFESDLRINASIINSTLITLLKSNGMPSIEIYANIHLVWRVRNVVCVCVARGVYVL